MTKPIEPQELLSFLPKRYPSAHKGSFGRLMLLAGSPQMPGCLALSAKGALCAGVGILECAAQPEALSVVKHACWESVYTALPSPLTEFEACLTTLRQRLKSATALAIGPGLAGGQPDSPLGQAVRDLILGVLQASQQPAVLDADGLSVFGSAPIFHYFPHRLVITPHPGEFSRLTGLPLPQVQANRQEIALAFSRTQGCVTLLKGHQTVVAAPDGRHYVNQTGNPYMARGGSGDVLTGMIGALLAQGVPPFEAACLGAYLHGGAGDLAYAQLGLSMLPSDLPQYIGRFLFQA